MCRFAILVVCNFTHSAPGRACLSIREDEIASEAMGINTTKYKVIAFVIGALLASLAGHCSHVISMLSNRINLLLISQLTEKCLDKLGLT